MTFLFTDIEGSTRLWESQREPMTEALARHDTILRQCIESRGGHIFTPDCGNRPSRSYCFSTTTRPWGLRKTR